jgi:hypothetical protein
MHQRGEITTIEGLGAVGDLHPLQEAFVKHDGYQCGYCTPGQICSAVGMLDEVAKGWPSYVSTDLGHYNLSDADQRAHERKHLALRRLPTLLHGSADSCGPAISLCYYGRRTYSGRPSSGIRFSAFTAIATSLARR